MNKEKAFRSVLQKPEMTVFGFHSKLTSLARAVIIFSLTPKHSVISGIEKWFMSWALETRLSEFKAQLS